MSQYLFILIWLAFMALLSANGALSKEEDLYGEKVFRINGLFAFIAFLPVIIMATNRGWFADTTAYIISYQRMPSTLDEIIPYTLNASKDKGFAFISYFMHWLFGRNYVPYLFIIALFQGIALTLFFRKHSENYIFSIFLFIATGEYISWMFNGMRQFMAVCIILLGVPLMMTQRYISLLLVIFIASTIHYSAWLMVAFVYISLGEAWNKRTLLFMAGVMFVLACTGMFTAGLDEALQGTQYKNVVSDYQSFNDDGVHPLRMLVYSVPAILSFFARKYISETKNKFINFCCNMSILTAGIYLIAMVTSGIYIGRLPIYCSLFSFVLLPWEINHFFQKGLRQMVYAGAVACYLVFYYIEWLSLWI